MVQDEEGFQSTKGNVQVFLKELIDILGLEKFIFIMPAREDKPIQYTNQYCLNALEFYDRSDIIRELCSLKVENYYQTKKDKNNKKFNEYYYEFGKIIQGKMVYIKIKIQSRDKKQVLCVSFHFPEFEMKRFPYK